MTGPRIPFNLWSVVAVVMVCASGVAGWMFADRMHPLPQPPAAPAAAVANEAKVATPMQSPTVQTYRPAVKAKLRLPTDLQAAPEQQVVAANTVKPSSHAYTLTTLINTETGQVETVQRQEPLPWLARDASGRMDMLVGYQDGHPVARLSATQNLLQAKVLHLGVTGAVTQHMSGQRDTDWLVGMNLGTSW